MFRNKGTIKLQRSWNIDFKTMNLVLFDVEGISVEYPPKLILWI